MDYDKIARQVSKRLAAGMAGIPPRPARSGSVCPRCDGDAEHSGVSGQVNCFSCGYAGPAADDTYAPRGEKRDSDPT